MRIYYEWIYGQLKKHNEGQRRIKKGYRDSYGT